MPNENENNVTPTPTPAEEPVVPTPAPTPNPAYDPIQALADLKANTVSKTKYEEVVADNAKLLKTLVEGGQIVQAAAKDKLPTDEDIAAMRSKLYGDPDEMMDNLSYVATTLELRDALLAKGEPDPFLPYGKHINPTDEDVAAAKRVAQAFKECVEYADGDPEIFTNELMRITVEDNPVGAAAARRRGRKN